VSLGDVCLVCSRSRAREVLPETVCLVCTGFLRFACFVCLFAGRILAELAPCFVTVSVKLFLYGRLY